MLLRGRNKNMKKEGKLAEYLLLHIFPFDILPNFLPLPTLKTIRSKKKVVRKGTEEKI